MAKRFVITREKHEVLLIGQNIRREIDLCPVCQKEVLWLSTKESAELFELTELQIFRRAENGLFHFRETPKGILLICTESIAAEKPNLKIIPTEKHLLEQ